MNFITEAVEGYAAEHSSTEPEWLLALAQETEAEIGMLARMMVGRIEGRFLKMLVAAVQPRLVLEIGTFTGYSSLSMAEALPDGGRILTCEINERHAEIARRHIAASPYAEHIEVRLGNAHDTVADLDGPFDLVFIDADKVSYDAYFEAVLPKLAPGGMIAVDNVLWSGNVINPDDTSDDTRAIRAFNDKVRNDRRVECVMLTVRDGVTLIRRAQPA
ncbi:MAG: O-methyltransferase [Actinobacteria bacterium]|nr:MAG: O-methyltransferase [Actinomycetota bacterium]